MVDVKDRGRGASLWDRKEKGATSAPMQEAMPVSPQGVIDNDFHPVDQGLQATDDHWGSSLSDMVSRGKK